ncbi:unnamed protein product [Caenorhabditis angaria]|uniref:F-box domain-containing protein n=1 Tax=Caenorhabditis angaria TaxID=860376 RepID=A0A9P1N1C5_9PELO|nr:unnamed protein product [Caenorhabditis angaria]
MGSCFSRENIQTNSEAIQKYSGITGWFELPYDVRVLIIDYLDLRTRRKLARCSQACHKEILSSCNFVDEIHIQDYIEEDIRHIGIVLISKDEKWLFRIVELPFPGNIIVRWEMPHPNGNNELISETGIGNLKPLRFVLANFKMFVKRNRKSLKSIRIHINDFPYHKCNIKNLRNPGLQDLILPQNTVHKVDPISCGFVDLDTIFRFHHLIKVPNLKLDYFMTKIKTKFAVLNAPIPNLEELDNFLRHCFIEEDVDDNFEVMKIMLKDADMNKEKLIEVIRKYADNVEFFADFSKFTRKSRILKHKIRCIYLEEEYLRYYTADESIDDDDEESDSTDSESVFTDDE